jgi:tripartite-type tricarboxylate transporter receptor subunit TctC
MVDRLQQGACCRMIAPMKSHQTLRFGIVCGLAALSVAHAQPYPAKPVRIVSPFAPGGPTDLLSRPVGARLHEMLGQPFVLDYKAGAAGAIGAEYVARSAPDGYTVLVITGSFSVAPATSAALPYDTLKDFTGIAPLARGHSVLVVHPRLPVKDMKDLVALARTQPGKLNYASSGAGSIIHLGMERLKLAAKIDMLHVPYKGVAPAMQDLMGGYVDLMFVGASPSIGHIRSGKLRVIAVAGPQRSSAFADIPTTSEMGYPGVEISSNYGFIAPAATPRAIVARLNEAVSRALTHADVVRAYGAFGVEPWIDSAERYTAWIAEDVSRWYAVTRTIKFQPGG